MGVSKRKERLRVRINIQGKEIKQVEEFKYLGSIFTEKADCEKEIRTRIAIAKAAFGNMKKVLTNISMNINLRQRILKCYVLSTLLYGCEAWTLKKNLRKKIEAVEMWFLHRMLRIPWTARITNEEVLRRAGTERTLINQIRKRQLNFLGHIIRANGLEKDCLLGRVQGRRARGRQRLKFMDVLKEQMDHRWKTADLIRMAHDRGRWRSLVADVT